MKNKAFFRHKLNQELYTYVEIDDSWKDSFVMEFQKSEIEPHFIKSGESEENRRVICGFNEIIEIDIKEALSSKDFEWIPVKPDEQLKYSAKVFKESILKNN